MSRFRYVILPRLLLALSALALLAALFLLWLSLERPLPSIALACRQAGPANCFTGGEVIASGPIRLNYAEPDADEKPAPKKRGRKPAAKAGDDESEDEKPAPKRRGRKPKAKPEPEPDHAEDEDDSDDEDEGKYSGMNAMQLFKECKKRGIKAAPKKPAKFYIELLEADDAKADDVDDSDDDDDDWDI